MKFKEFINESKVIVYHGDDFGTKKLDPKFMNNGNNQEGIGIYFGSFETAELYGKYIIQAEIDTKKFIDSRKNIGEYINSKQLSKILIDMWKSDEETMYYMITDWIEVSEPEDVKLNHIEYLAEKMQDEEVRNFQITLAEQFGVVNFVKSWNKHYKNIHGTYQKQNADEIWYCIINTKQKVTFV